MDDYFRGGTPLISFHGHASRIDTARHDLSFSEAYHGSSCFYFIFLPFDALLPSLMRHFVASLSRNMSCHTGAVT